MSGMKKRILLILVVVIVLGTSYFGYSVFNEITEDEAVQIATEKYVNYEERTVEVSNYYSNEPDLQFFFQDKTPIYSVTFYSHTELKNWEGWVLVNTHINGRNGEIISIDVYSRDPEKVKW